MRQRALLVTGVVGLIGLSCALILSGGVVSLTTAGQTDDLPDVFRPGTDVTIAGAVSVSTWEIPEGVTVSVPSDLIVDCSGDIVIKGQLVAEQVGSADFGHGASITLRTPGTVKLSGLIRAGNGAETPRAFGPSGDVGLTGGRGGDVTIEAAAVVGTGGIRAGDGGEGSLGGGGGDGGRVMLDASAASPEMDSPLIVQGGTGGRGGDGVPGFANGVGGDGGNGGDAFVVPAGNGAPGDPGGDDIKTGCAANGIPILCGGFGVHPQGYVGANAIGGDGGNGGNGTQCGDGGAGGRGGNAQSQCGGNGSDGANCDPNGGAGGSGGNGGVATGGRGGKGGNGEECCCGPNGPGGDGGAGGQGGTATSGHGGNGGDGGNSTRTPFYGAGGNGGNGANGGSATGGHGGSGGDGAKGTPVGSGGARGLGGTASAGTGGSGGAGGMGVPWGTPGVAGTAGTATHGVAGTLGSPGNTTCAIHSAAVSADVTATVPPAPSPGIMLTQTSIERQSLESGGYHIARNSETQCRYFCWSDGKDLPVYPGDQDTLAWFGTFDGSTFQAVCLNAPGPSRASHPNLAVSAQDLANVVLWQRESPSSPFETWFAHFANYCDLGFNSAPIITGPPCDEYIEPRIAISQRPAGADIVHVISNPTSDCPSGSLAYYRYEGGVWSGPALIEVLPGYSYAIAADRNSEKVAIIAHTIAGGMRNVEYYESQTGGVGWLSGAELGPSFRHLITNYNDPGTGIEAWHHISAAYDNASDLHIIWEERVPPSSGTAAIIRHWSRQTSVIHRVASGLWTTAGLTGQYDLNLAKMTLGIGDGCTPCQGGMTTNLNYLYVVYTQFGGTTPAEQSDCSMRGYMNGELYLTVSTDHGLTWSPPQNLTNTKTPNCNPGLADPTTGNPSNPDGVCRSEHWASIGVTVNDIDVLYVSDLDAGFVKIDGQSTWQQNPLMYLNLPGTTTNAQYVCPVLAPKFYAELLDPSNCLPHAAPGGYYEMQLVVRNEGNSLLTGSVSTTTTVGPPGMLKINGGTNPIGYSVEPQEEIGFTVGFDATGITNEGIYSGRVAITHNDPSQVSPFVIPTDFYVFDEFVSGDGCQPVYTPAGSNVVVHVNDYLTLTFFEVTTPGLTAVTTSSSGPTSDPSFVLLPSGTPLYYEIQTTTAFVPPVYVCFTYDPALDPSPECPFPMKLGHYDGASWVDVTAEWDCNAHLVCGEVTTLSPFALAQSLCTCACKYDPQCDGVRSNVQDVVQTVNVAFRGTPGVVDPGCPRERTDVDANGFTNVQDVVAVVNVAFRGAFAATTYVDPCAP